jgi:hypothetical protein
MLFSHALKIETKYYKKAIIQLDEFSFKIMDGKIYPIKRIFHQNACVNRDILIALKFMGGGNPHGYSQYSLYLCQNLKGNPHYPIHLIYKDLCLH